MGKGDRQESYVTLFSRMLLRLVEADRKRKQPIRKAVTRIGQQHETDVWVLEESVQINAKGVLAPQSEQAYTCLNWSIQTEWSRKKATKYKKTNDNSLQARSD